MVFMEMNRSFDNFCIWAKIQLFILLTDNFAGSYLLNYLDVDKTPGTLNATSLTTDPYFMTTEGCLETITVTMPYSNGAGSSFSQHPLQIVKWYFAFHFIQCNTLT